MNRRFKLVWIMLVLAVLQMDSGAQTPLQKEDLFRAGEKNPSIGETPLDPSANLARLSAVQRPNFVFLLCDDLGYGDLGCYGNTNILTPNLDKLAADGLRLTDCYSAAPVCSPSRAALLTGRIPQRLGITDWIKPGSGVHLKRDETTVAQLLRKAGYNTALFGKLHTSSRLDGTEPTPTDYGFQSWLCTQNNAAPSHQSPTNFIRNGKPAGPMRGHATSIVIDEAINFIERSAGSPFLVFVTFHAPHEPISTPSRITSLYPGETNANRAAYLGSVSMIDAEVGRLLRVLDGRLLRDNTVVFFTSDNGPETLNRYKGSERSYGSAGALRGMKLHVTDGGFRVPGIIRWPQAIQAGGVSAEPVSGLDLLPTFAELAGVPVAKDLRLDGTSIVPLLQGKGLVRKQPLYWEYPAALSNPWKLALRDGPWKLLSTPDFSRFELFNLSLDPSETASFDASQTDRVAEMSRRLRQIHAEVHNLPPPVL